MSLEVGNIVEGVVTNITNFGAFVELPDGRTGLVHISEVADSYVTDVRQHVQERERIQVKILGINEKGKYDLSIRQARNPEPGAAPPPRARRGKGKARLEDSGDPRFEEMLARFKKESEERLLDLKRNTEAKRGKGRGR
ncbi:MAG TPA: S1 RNA-binding domain-containing protein [Candidatus Nitrosotenuis sp.]|jgi:S1 RNA binding domain protein|nr:S1 RNA-binding domain-containing protein [Candidatus Nitrosotenuis sp.]